ncbi:Protein of unknown function [Arenibacter nanhaiticus]|uniref:Uncharacterized protein n=1 Tax=Arenibacter nanhaiticus TaxID=558155 RepID=A0A1M6MA11_9FLAO|nr:DUF1428 family protein [Arenibacter nanhaiticus]SHJ80249.1 Protein of unknown function [Arenibacter nanhaiticus]
MKRRSEYLYPKDINTKNYIDGFVLPIPRIYLDEFKKAVEKIAEIRKEYGAIAYFIFVGDDLSLQGTKSFIETRGCERRGGNYFWLGIVSFKGDT